MKKRPKDAGKKHKLKLPSQRTLAFAILGTVLFVFVINLAVFLTYRNKTYPKTKLNNTLIGTVSFASLTPKAQDVISPPDKITLKVQTKSKDISSEQLGVSVDYDALSKNIRENRYAIPVLNFFAATNTEAAYSISQQTSDATLESLRSELETAATPAHVTLQETQFVAVPAQAAISINAEQASQTIASQLHTGQTSIDLPINETPAPENAVDINAEALKLNSAVGAEIAFSYSGQNKTLAKTDIAAVFEAKDATFAVSQKQVNALVDKIAKQFGIILGNRQQAASQLTTALQNGTDVTVALQAAPQKRVTYTYCVAAKGVDQSYLGTLKSKLQAVYGDSRGWSVNGQVQFSPVASGCSFTVWLTAADLVPSFSSTICDNIWSCRVGNNVILNFDRWSGASSAWNSAGGTLDEYRSMVINHETGHWLGFSHRYCSGAGQPAPVMQQQSISLQGCSFNAWPTASEIQALKKSKGL